jgi:hypothetical protein
MFLDVKRAAEAVSMSPRWIRSQIVAGLPCLRTEGKILIDQEVLRKWLLSKYGKQAVDIDSAVQIANSLMTKQDRRKGSRK